MPAKASFTSLIASPNASSFAVTIATSNAANDSWRSALVSASFFWIASSCSFSEAASVSWRAWRESFTQAAEACSFSRATFFNSRFTLSDSKDTCSLSIFTLWISVNTVSKAAFALMNSAFAPRSCSIPAGSSLSIHPVNDVVAPPTKSAATR